MSEGPESPKSHHKLVLPENVPKSAFYTVILGEMDPIRWYLGQIWSKMAKNATLELVSTNYPYIEITFFVLLSFISMVSIILYSYLLRKWSYPPFIGEFIDIWVKFGQKWPKIANLGLVCTKTRKVKKKIFWKN